MGYFNVNAATGQRASFTTVFGSLTGNQIKFMEELHSTYASFPSGNVYQSGLFPFSLRYDFERNILNQPFTDQEIHDAIDTAISRGQDYVAYDFETSSAYTDNRNYSDTIVDNMLNEISGTYRRHKEYNPNIYVCFLGLGALRSYFACTGNGASVATNDAWKNAYRRLNQRVSGTGYINAPVCSFNDFFVTNLYSFYGDFDATGYKNYVEENLANVSGIVAGGKPVFSYFFGFHHPSTSHFGRSVSNQILDILVSGVRHYGNGMNMWGSASYTAVPTFKLRPSVSGGNYLNWTTIPTGCMTITLSQFTLDVTGLNFSSCTNMNQIAGVLTTGINNRCNSIVVNTGIVSTSTNLSNRVIGPVNIWWDSVNQHFLCVNHAGSGLVSGMIRPPDLGAICSITTNPTQTVYNGMTNLINIGYVQSSDGSPTYIANYLEADLPYNYPNLIESIPSWQRYLSIARAEITSTGVPYSLNNSFDMYLQAASTGNNSADLFMIGYYGDPTNVFGNSSNNLTLRSLHHGVNFLQHL